MEDIERRWEQKNDIDFERRNDPNHETLATSDAFSIYYSDKQAVSAQLAPYSELAKPSAPAKSAPPPSAYDELRTVGRGLAFGALKALTGGFSAAVLKPTVDERLDPKFHSASDWGEGALSVGMIVLSGAPTVGGPTLAPSLAPQAGGVAVAAAEVAWSITGTGALVLGAIGIATTTGSGGDEPEEPLAEATPEQTAAEELGLTLKEIAADPKAAFQKAYNRRPSKKELANFELRFGTFTARNTAQRAAGKKRIEVGGGGEHTSGKRGSTAGKHEAGQARKAAQEARKRKRLGQ